MNIEITFTKRSINKYKKYKNIKKIKKIREQKQKNKIESKQKKYNTEQKTNEQTASVGFTHLEKRYIGEYYCEEHHSNGCMCSFFDDWSDWGYDSDYDTDYNEDQVYEEEFENSDDEEDYYFYGKRKEQICKKHKVPYYGSCRFCNFLNPSDSILETTYAAGIGDLDYLVELHSSEIPYRWDEYTTLWAAQNGHIDCFKYAIENGCPYDRSDCYFISIWNGKIRQYFKQNSEEKIKEIQKLKSCEVLYTIHNIPKDVVKYNILPYW